MLNVIRTAALELTIIPAIAYKQKLRSGGAGIKLMRLDMDATAMATIDKRTGEAVAYGQVDTALFPLEAFDEAVELIAGLPYSSRGKITLNTSNYSAAVDKPEIPEINMVESDEYKAIIVRYKDEKGKINYTLMNKDFIQYTSKSKTVANMISNRAQIDEILVNVIKNRATFLAGKKENLDDNHVKVLIEMLDEIDPRNAFKELRSYISRMLSRS
ncbi:hypothetical protein AwWohl_09150 [Gammaproteobacteria bacterium]|nr:hypothetical protein AwWohl_09150 [Gammaproteobacteria bacterium]